MRAAGNFVLVDLIAVRKGRRDYDSKVEISICNKLRQNYPIHPTMRVKQTRKSIITSSRAIAHAYVCIYIYIHDSESYAHIIISRTVEPVMKSINYARESIRYKEKGPYAYIYIRDSSTSALSS